MEKTNGEPATLITKIGEPATNESGSTAIEDAGLLRRWPPREARTQLRPGRDRQPHS
jgi:hypothetical protein